jgi:hypothetical protein
MSRYAYADGGDFASSQRGDNNYDGVDNSFDGDGVDELCPYVQISVGCRSLIGLDNGAANGGNGGGGNNGNGGGGGGGVDALVALFVKATPSHRGFAYHARTEAVAFDDAPSFGARFRLPLSVGAASDCVVVLVCLRFVYLIVCVCVFIFLVRSTRLLLLSVGDTTSVCVCVCVCVLGCFRIPFAISSCTLTLDLLLTLCINCEKLHFTHPTFSLTLYSVIIPLQRQCEVAALKLRVFDATGLPALQSPTSPLPPPGK